MWRCRLFDPIAMIFFVLPLFAVLICIVLHIVHEVLKLMFELCAEFWLLILSAVANACILCLFCARAPIVQCSCSLSLFRLCYSRCVPMRTVERLAFNSVWILLFIIKLKIKCLFPTINSGQNLFTSVDSPLDAIFPLQYTTKCIQFPTNSEPRCIFFNFATTRHWDDRIKVSSILTAAYK